MLKLTRRASLSGAAAFSAWPLAQTTSLAAKPAPGSQQTAGPLISEFLDYDPVTNFHHAMRLQRSMLDEDDILHWYHFIMMAVMPGRAPAPVVRWEGIELSRHLRVKGDLFRLHGHNLSFPRDLDTGEFTNDVLNPITGRRVQPRTLALTEDPGLFVSPLGIVTLDDPTATFRPRYAKIRREGELVKIDAIRVPPADWPATFLEMGYEAAPAALFDDPSHLWLPGEVSGAYVFPYPDWMKMGDAPGHMFAAWSGSKLRSVDELPRDFVQKAQAERPDLLEIDPAPFDRPAVLPKG